MKISDEVVSLALDGNQLAVREIVSALESPIFNLAYRMMVSIEDAEDASQEALLKIITHLSQWDKTSQFSTWAWRVAINRMLDYRDSQYRKSRYSSEVFIEDIESAELAERPEDALVVSRVKMGCAAAMLQVLDGKSRAVYLLGEVLELSGREVSEIVDMSEAAVRQSLSRSRTKLRSILDHCGVVNSKANCSCEGRVNFAKTKGRIPALLIDEPISKDRLNHVVQMVDGMAQVAEFYKIESVIGSSVQEQVNKLLDI